MRDQLESFGDAAVAAITFASPDRLADHRRHLDLPYPLLADPERAIYRRFDLGRGALHQIWTPGTILSYARLLRQGRRVQRPTEDTRQLGGDFIIGTAGELAASFRPRSPDQRPTMLDLTEAVDRARRPKP